ncbi:YfbM family protein [Sphingobacterium sp. BIGb0116]|uniref:YfbM family protein n=1 Tax=Sphingobacterium sp. BIGb0116 TaxID=2940619 RepID=UPI002167DCF5|nr:YfbM family protein [Sphingobacterium sp. BIGb0116]
MIQQYIRIDNKTLHSFIEDSSRLEDIIFKQDNTDNESFLDLDKAWDGVFFLITGQSLANAVEEEAPLLGRRMERLW